MKRNILGFILGIVVLSTIAFTVKAAANYFVIFESRKDSLQYIYSPDVVKKDNQYYIFFNSWERSSSKLAVSNILQYVQSNDGMHYSSPQAIVQVDNNNTGDTLWSDVNIVKYGNFYYLYFLQKKANLHGKKGIGVARSNGLTGPYQFLSDTNQWVANPNNLKILVPIDPFGNFNSGGQSLYEAVGHGYNHFSVVNVDNTLHLWLGKVSATSKRDYHTYYLTSTDPLNWDWNKAQLLSTDSVNLGLIKYDATNKRFLSFRLQKGKNQTYSFILNYSTNGIDWDKTKFTETMDRFLRLDEIIGVSSDETGSIDSINNILIAFNGVEAKQNHKSIVGDLFGMFVNLSSQSNSSGTPTPQPNGTSTPTPISGGTNCGCNNTSCSPKCQFDKYSDVVYNDPLNCQIPASYFSSSPSNADRDGWCTNQLRTKGDTNRDGVVDYIDYYYLERALNGGLLPPSYIPDFNGDGEAGGQDRLILVRTLNGQ